MDAMIGIITASVNGHLTASPPAYRRLKYRTMIEDVLARIERRLKEVKLSATAASRAAGLSPDAIRNMRRAVGQEGRGGVSTKTLAALAPVLGTTPGWLLTGNKDETSSAVVPIVGRIGADASGEIVYASADQNYGHVPLPFGANPDTVAVEVRGHSQGFLSDGAIVYYSVKHELPLPDMLGVIVVVGLSDGRVLLKRLLRGSQPHLFDLESTSAPTIRDATIDWAAHVDFIVPPWRANQIRLA